MKHTSRKKMLLSSIAMLLVALVALGSATYAWFTISKTVTAEDIQVKAITTAGLEISNTSATSGYDSSVSFSTPGEVSLKPISWDTAAANGYLPAANVESADGTYTGTYKTGEAPITSIASGNNSANANFAAFKVWVRSAANADGSYSAHTVDATVTATGGSGVLNGTAYARARLIDVSTSSKTRNFWDAASGSGTGIKATDGTTNSIDYKAFGTVSDSTASPAVDMSVSSTNANETGKEFILLVWFDGADADCKDANKNATADFTITFTATDM